MATIVTAQPGKSSGYVTRTRTSSLPVRIQEKEVSRRLALRACGERRATYCYP